MLDDTDPESRTIPPPNTFTVSHILNHRPSQLTPPPLSPHTPASAASEPAAFDYLTVWVGFEGEDTWEPRSSFWDEWKVSEYWKERRQQVAARNGWGTKRAVEEEREEKERVVQEWRECWADELKRQKKSGRRGAAGSSQKRKKREPVESWEPAAKQADELKEGPGMQTGEADEKEAGKEEVKAELDQPAAKRRRTRSSGPPASGTVGDVVKMTRQAFKAHEANRVQKETEKERTQQPTHVAPVSTDDSQKEAAPTSPQPPLTIRSPSPTTSLPPPSPPRPHTSLSTDRADRDSVTPSPRLHPPPPAAPPPSPPPRRLSSSSLLAVTLPALHPVLAEPRLSGSVVASDDDTIPTSSQPDDEDLALTPVAMTVSSSISFDRQTSESDADEADNDLSGRRRVRFNEHPVRIQLKVWEEDDEKDATEAADSVVQPVHEEKEEPDDTDADSSREEQPVQPAQRPLLPRKARDYLDRTFGKSVPQRPDRDERSVEHKQREKKQIDMLGERVDQQRDDDDETDEQPRNDEQRAATEQDARMEIVAEDTSEKQAEPPIQSEAMAEAPSATEESVSMDEQAQSIEIVVSTPEVIATSDAAPQQTEQQTRSEAVAMTQTVDEASETVVEQALSVDAAMSIASTAAVSAASPVENNEVKDDQSVAQPIKEQQQPSLSLPSPEQQLAALSPPETAATDETPSVASHLDETEDDAPEKEEDDDQFVVEQILHRRKRRGHVEYLIHWQGYTVESDSWEPEENLSCNDLLEEFEAKAASKQRGNRARGGRSKKPKESADAGPVEPQASKVEDSATMADNIDGAKMDAENEKDENGAKSVETAKSVDKPMEVEVESGSDAKVENPETVTATDEKKRIAVELRRRRVSPETPQKNGIRGDSNDRRTVRRLSAPSATTSKRLTEVDCKSVEQKSVADCTLEELEFIARVKRREEVKVANREKKERQKREMVAATQVSLAARPVRALSNGASSASEKTAAPLKPGLLKRANGSSVSADKLVKRSERADSKENGSATASPTGSKTNGAVSRIPKMSRPVVLSNGSLSPLRVSSNSSAYNSPPPKLRSPPLSPPVSPPPSMLSDSFSTLTYTASLPSALSTVLPALLVAQLGEINDALTTVPATQRSLSQPAPAPSASSVSSPPPPPIRSVSASDAPQPSAAQSDNVLLMGDAALAFSLVLLDHRSGQPTTNHSALHPPSLTCPSTPFLSLLSCHPKLYCVPASGELTTLLPLSLTCGHLKAKRLYLRQDVDPLHLSESFPELRFGCVQLSLGSEGENTDGEMQLMGQLMCSVAQVMSAEGVLRWTVVAQPSTDTQRTDDSMRQRGTAAGLQLVSVERTYLGSLQPPAAADDLNAVLARLDRETVHGEVKSYMGGETYIFTRAPPPPQLAPPAAVDEARVEEERRTERLSNLRRERAEEQERERQTRDQRARNKYAALVKQPSTEAVQTTHSYHQAPLQLPNQIPRFDTDQARYSAQAYLQHRLNGHGPSMHITAPSYGSAYVR